MGTPPFYMIAFKPEGVTTRSFIGTDPNNLTWTVDQPEGGFLFLVCFSVHWACVDVLVRRLGSRLLLTVADSLMLSGGQPPQLFNVTGEQMFFTFSFLRPISLAICLSNLHNASPYLHARVCVSVHARPTMHVHARAPQFAVLPFSLLLTPLHSSLSRVPLSLTYDGCCAVA